MNDKWAMRIDRVLDPIATPIEKLFRFVFSWIGRLLSPLFQVIGWVAKALGWLLLVVFKALGRLLLLALGLGLVVLCLAVTYAVARWAYLLVFH
jgi:hypothetical protein